MVTADAASTKQFLEQIEGVFHKAFPSAFIDVSPGYGDHIHVILVSRQFDGMTEKEKQDLVWDVARREFDVDAQRISLLLAYSPDELK